MKAIYIILCIIIPNYVVSQIFPEPTGMSGFSNQKKIIDQCEAWTACGFLQIKTNTVARRFTYDISLWNEMYQIYGKEKKLLGCLPSMTCLDCEECEFTWNKFGRITIIRNNNANKHKLQVGWKADKNNENQLLLSAYFHEVINSKDSSKDDNSFPEYWVSHYIKNVHTDTKHYIDMYLSIGMISMIIDYTAVVMRKPGMIPSNNKKSYLMRSFYCGDDLLTDVTNCVPSKSLAIKYTDQKYDKSGFPDRLNQCKVITVNLSEFESEDEHSFYSYEIINGSISDPNLVNFEEGYPNPVKQKCIIKSGADITFAAGKSVKLYKGFHAKADCHFVAKIQKKEKFPGFDDKPKKLNLPPLEQRGCGKSYVSSVNDAIEKTNFDSLSDFSNGIFSIYPNPSHTGLFTLRFNDGESESYAVEVRSTTGNTVFRQDAVHDNAIAVDIRNEPKGLYIVKVTAGNKVYTEKVIVQ